MVGAGRAYGRVQILRTLPLVLAAGRPSSQAALVNDWAARAPSIRESARVTSTKCEALLLLRILAPAHGLVEHPEIAAVDVNPIMVGDRTAMAVDALVIVDGGSG